MWGGLGCQPGSEFWIKYDQFVFYGVFLIFGIVLHQFQLLGGCCAVLSAFLVVLQPVKGIPIVKASKSTALMRVSMLLFLEVLLVIMVCRYVFLIIVIFILFRFDYRRRLSVFCLISKPYRVPRRHKSAKICR